MTIENKILEFRMSNHAEKRMEQRGIKKRHLEVLISEFDVVQDIGDGKVAISVSHKRMKNLCSKNRAKQSKLGSIVAIISGQTLVTVLKDYKDKNNYRGGRKHRDLRRKKAGK
ncbi:MAG: hypothetical protein ACKVIX_02755 [Sphingomonadales bacterium]